jgi:4-hydroxybenzoate polyprenyltransferase
MIALFNIPFLFALFFVNMQTVIAFLLFLFFAIQYSAYPIRAKIRPILDSIFSASHYVVT